jgi:dTDP-6-deoxy-L-talose 4-dehydrogenase (NAD+)
MKAPTAAPTIAITGATGFIGRHVLAELDRRGIEAVLLCRSPQALTTRGYALVALDVHGDLSDLRERCGAPQVLLHLAWGGLPHYQSLHHVEVERPAHYRFIKAMVEAGVRHVVAVGTCYEYGMQYGPLHEALDTRPVTAYGQAKDTLRRELELLARNLPFELTWPRLFYMYGRGQAPQSIYSQLRAAAERGDAEFPMSAGEQLRDYLPVERVAEALVDLALLPANCGVVNVCSGQPVSVRALVERWIRDNGWSIQPALGHYPYPAHEPLAFWGDAGKLARNLSASEATEPKS